VVRPVICICEYNAVFGNVWPLSVPYEPNFARAQPEFNNLYFGASITALQSLASRKGYRFLGTNSEGVNAFFVRQDYASKFESLLANPTAQPSKFRESRDRSGQLSFSRGLERCHLIRDLPVVNTVTLEKQNLGRIQPLYSDSWQQILEIQVRPERAATGPSQ
jgi:hypothetical protein